MDERKQRVIDLWISNGSNPEMNITRNEVMIMLWKLVEIIETRYWKISSFKNLNNKMEFTAKTVSHKIKKKKLK